MAVPMDRRKKFLKKNYERLTTVPRIAINFLFSKNDKRFMAVHSEPLLISIFN